jgi:serine/threonine-protein kinase RsbW
MQTIELKIPCESGFEKVAMNTAGDCARMLGMAEERIEDVRTAVSEACINAMEHGNANDVATKVYVAVTIDRDRLAIDVADEGRSGPPPDPDRLPAPDLGAQIEGLAPAGGMGLFLIKALVDEAEFVEPEAGYGSQFRMVIHVTPKESTP